MIEYVGVGLRPRPMEGKECILFVLPQLRPRVKPVTLGWRGGAAGGLGSRDASSGPASN